MYSCPQTDQIDILYSKTYRRFVGIKGFVSLVSNYGMRGDIGVETSDDRIDYRIVMITRSRESRVKIHEIIMYRTEQIEV